MAAFALSRGGWATVVLALAAAVGAAGMAPPFDVTAGAGVYEQLGPFYQHDIVSRPNFTTLVNVRGYTKTEGFGAIAVFDDPITVAPDVNSQPVGRAKGTNIVTSLDMTSTLTTQTVYLAGGTLTFIGEFSFIPGASNKLHCVGGTGEYQSVQRGIFELEVFSFDDEALNAVLKVTISYQKS